MTSDDREREFLRGLRGALVRLYDDAGKVRRVMADAGIPADNVALGGALNEQWNAVLEEAQKRGGARRLLEVALRDYPGDEALRAMNDGRPAGEHVLVVSAFDRYVGSWRPTHEVDWVRFFEGDEVPSRRRVRDPSLWDDRFKRDLADAEQALRRCGAMRVRVEGWMRLMTWFMVGHALPRVRKFALSREYYGAVWSTEAAATPSGLRVTRTVLGRGDELAVALSVSNAAGADVARWAQAEGLPLAALVELSTEVVGKGAVRDGAHARGCAEAVVDAVREQVRETGASRVHLFASAPDGLMLFVGHLWNALPPARLYEHAPPGYVATFSVPG